MSGISKRVVLVVVAVAVLLVAAPAALAAGGVPRPDHIVVVMEENTSASSIYGNTANAPYINSLAQAGAKMTQSFAITHPSQPNYLALFSGSQQGVTDDACPQTFTGVANLGADLIAAGDTFGGYSEDLPAAGSTVCTSGNYARKHVPWVNFDNVPSADNRQFSAWPSSDFTQLPTVSFVIPNLCDDMHNCPISTGDTWLLNNIGSYAQWAKTHNSVLIVTWDENDSSVPNQIATIFYGAGITPGTYSESINHYSVLRTIEDAYGLPHDGNAATASPITDIWATPGPTVTVTVTNPGIQTAVVGTSVGLQMHATASDGGGLTYSATGLPAGLTISSAGLVSGTPTSAGASLVTVTAAEASGTSGTATFTWTVTPRPSLSKLSIRPKAFSAAPHGGSIAGKLPKAKRHRPPIGTRVTYIDSAAATATFTVWKTVFGSRRGKSCVKARGTVPHHARCQLLVALGSFKHSDVAGANRFDFTGRIKGHKLRPGKYLLSATPAGGVAVTIRFRIR